MPLVKCETSQTKGKVSEFEVIKNIYTIIDKNGKSQQKTSEKTERVKYILTYEEIYKKLGIAKKDYICHKY